MRLSPSVSLLATVSSSSISSRPCSTISDGCIPWRYVTVEWSPKVAKLYETQPSAFTIATQWVFPDLPQVYTKEHRLAYWKSIMPDQRIQTLAACQHTTWQSLLRTAKERLEWTDTEGGKGKLLLVGGNDKTPTSITSVQAAAILRSELGDSAELWAVADPNDPESVHKFQSKVDAGITGFLTQPILTSTAWDTLQSYHSRDVSVVAGMALPRSAKNLQFWRQLLDRPDVLEQDPLFQSHLAYFSQPYTTPLVWIGRELQQFTNMNMGIDGVHFMPLQNTGDLTTLLRSLSVKLAP